VAPQECIYDLTACKMPCEVDGPTVFALYMEGKFPNALRHVMLEFIHRVSGSNLVSLELVNDFLVDAHTAIIALVNVLTDSSS